MSLRLAPARGLGGHSYTTMFLSLSPYDVSLGLSRGVGAEIQSVHVSIPLSYGATGLAPF